MSAKKFDTYETKNQEIEALQNFAEKFSDRSYLGSLFTQAFMDWVEAQVMNDHLPNIMAEYENVCRADTHATEVASERLVEIDGLRQENSTLVARNHELHEELGSAETEIESLETSVRNQEIAIEDLKGSKRRIEDEANEAHRRNEHLNTELASATDRAEAAEAMVEAMELSILKLKARMFDMLTADQS